MFISPSIISVELSFSLRVDINADVIHSRCFLNSARNAREVAIGELALLLRKKNEYRKRTINIL